MNRLAMDDAAIGHPFYNACLANSRSTQKP